MVPSPPSTSLTATPTGAHLIAQTLLSLNIPIVFGIVGIPIIEVAEALVASGIRFVGFRNEQAASYAASAYGYLTGRPGVLLVVGGPGVVHALAGVHGSQQNHFPLLLLSGSHPSTHLPTRGSFQTLSATTFLAPHTKIALRAPTPSHLPQIIREAYRTAFWGRPGAAAVEINGNYVTYKLDKEELGSLVHKDGRLAVDPVGDGPQPEGDRERIKNLAGLLINSAKRPLIVVGKGAAYSRCESVLKAFVERTQIPFLPTPMGKGLLPSDHPLDVSASRSLALSSSDLIILLGARLNWILHFGEPPKLSPNIQICKIDLSAEELGRNISVPGVSPSAQGEDLSIVGDCGAVLTQLLLELDAAGWEDLSPKSSQQTTTPWIRSLHTAGEKSVQKLAPKLSTPTPAGRKLTYHRTFHLLQTAFAELSSSSSSPSSHWTDDVVFISEGANTMDISRSIFPISLPRQRLDAGTDATMGVGPGYAIASWCAYNLPEPQLGSASSTPVLGAPKRKKIIAIEGDSAFGFSAMEIETMARYHMDIIIVVVNNGGVYRGIEYAPKTNPSSTESGKKHWETDPRRESLTLPTTALSYHTQYATLGDALGAKGFQVWGLGDGSDGVSGIEGLLLKSVKEAWRYSEGEGGRKRGPVVIDVEIESGEEKELVFAWLSAEKRAGGKKEAKL